MRPALLVETPLSAFSEKHYIVSVLTMQYSRKQRHAKHGSGRVSPVWKLQYGSVQDPIPGLTDAGHLVYYRLGYNWATGLLAFLCLAMAPFP